MTHPAVERAKQIVASCEWEGDMRVNMTTIIGAGRVLAKRVDELEAQVKTAIRGKSFWEFACEWYRPKDIHRAIRHREDIPTDVTSYEFAEWLAEQYRLAMVKGMEIVARDKECA